VTKLALHRVDETIHGLKLSIEVPETSRRNAVGDEVLWSFDRGGQPAILLRELGPAGDAATETDALVAGYGEGKKLSRKEVVADGGIAIWADERGFRFARLAQIGRASCRERV